MLKVRVFARGFLFKRAGWNLNTQITPKSLPFALLPFLKSMTFIDLPRLKVLVTTFPHMHTITLVKLDLELLWSLSQFTIP